VRLIRDTRAGGRSFTRKVVEHTIDQTGAPKVFSVTLSCVMAGGPSGRAGRGPQARSSPAGETALGALQAARDEAPVLRSEGEVSGVVAVLHDVTREKEIAQMKTDFVSNVSHELRTPLSSIKAYVEMLIDGEASDDKTRREFYDIIAGESDRLSRLIDNILNISRIESGVVRVVREPISLTEVAKQVLDVLLPQARLKDIKLVDRLAPVYHQVEADKDMIYQAVLNLGGNALKYTPQGGTVTLSASVDERRGVALVEVSDTGVGISPEDLPHIFDKFYRVQSHTKMAKGTGLGLTLVKHIVETVHDGKLSVTSETGKGSTFSFELPILQ
jgi:two-component system phosphate regulon sensor histidine kinase PhoR